MIVPAATLALTVAPPPAPVVSTYRPGTAYPRASSETAFVSLPVEGRSYAHHPAIAEIGGLLVAMWSSGRRDEDAPGQTALWSVSTDFAHWSPPRAFVPPGSGEIQTAAGFARTPNGLVAYVADYDAARRHTRLRAFASLSGEAGPLAWTPPKDLGLGVCPNRAPRRLASGRLVLSSNFLFPYSDSPAGLGPWTRAGIVSGPALLGDDNPGTFSDAERRANAPRDLCEGAFFQTDDGVLHLLLRATSGAYDGRLRLAESRDEGRTWSRPVPTAFPDDDAKFALDRLPDGRFLYVGNPGAPYGHGRRHPLALSLSLDGRTFGTHLILGNDPWTPRFPGRFKTGDYGYPEVWVGAKNLYAVASRGKEAIQAFRIPFAALPAPR